LPHACPTGFASEPVHFGFNTEQLELCFEYMLKDKKGRKADLCAKIFNELYPELHLTLADIQAACTFSAMKIERPSYSFYDCLRDRSAHPPTCNEERLRR
jgi:hypothetical protein